MQVQCSLYISQFHFLQSFIGHGKGLEPRFVAFVRVYRDNMAQFSGSMS